MVELMSIQALPCLQDSVSSASKRKLVAKDERTFIASILAFNWLVTSAARFQFSSGLVELLGSRVPIPGLSAPESLASRLMVVV